jgi:hypothetical protein
VQTQPEIQRDLERYRKDALYFDRHREELLQRYPDRWVAIYNQEVVGTAKDLERLIHQLEKKGLSPGQVYRGHLSTTEELLILSAHPR